MTTRLTHFTRVILLLGLLGAACAQPAIPEPQKVEPPTITPSSTPTATTAPSSTSTPLPTYTMTPKIEETTTSTPTPIIDWNKYIHPTIAPLTDVKIETSPPDLYYFMGNVLFKEIYNQGSAITTVFSQIDFVRDAVWVEDSIAILRPQEVILFNPISKEWEMIVQLKTPIRQGQLFYNPASKSLVYRGEIEDSRGAFGIGNLLGIYDIDKKINTEIPFVYTMYTSYEILGFDADNNDLYLLPKGQDPSFGNIWIYNIVDCQLITRTDTRGEEYALLSPDFNFLSTALFNDSSNSGLIRLYDLPQPSSTPQTFILPDPPSHFSAISWSPDGRLLYFLLKDGRIYADSNRSKGIWSLDVSNGKMHPIILTSDNWWTWYKLDSQWVILFPAINGKVNIVNLLSGNDFSFSLPTEAGIVVHTN